MRFSSTRSALRSRSFALFAAGNLVSQTGEWMTWVALNWVVFETTESALYLAVINACRLVPAFVLSVPAGILADRFDRRWSLIPLYTGVVVSTFWVGFLLSSPFWILALVVALRSALMAMVVPFRNAIIPNLVSEHQVASAVAVDTSVRNLARILGPALAGVLLVATQAAAVFWISASSIAVVLLSLYFLRPNSERERVSGDIKRNFRGDFREASTYVRDSPVVMSVLILTVAPMIFAFPYTAMMPLFADELLNVGPDALGLLLSVAAVGALAGSAWLSFGGEVRGEGRWLVISILAFGLSLLMFMFSRTVFVAAVMLFLVGLSSSVYRTMSRLILQTQVPDHLRGRILSIALMDRGFVPLGAILIGAVAELAGTLWAGIFMGGGCLVVTLAVITARGRLP